MVGPRAVFTERAGPDIGVRLENRKDALRGVGGTEALLPNHTVDAILDLELIGQAPALCRVVRGASLSREDGVGQQKVAVIRAGADGRSHRVDRLTDGAERELRVAGRGQRVGQSAGLVHDGHRLLAALLGQVAESGRGRRDENEAEGNEERRQDERLGPYATPVLAAHDEPDFVEGHLHP
jgi:hypothetical protein